MLHKSKQVLKMKKFFISLVMVLAVISIAVAQDNSTDLIPEAEDKVQGPVMQLDTLVVDYGTIDQHSEPLRTLDFTNVGDEPLVITNARGSCGCTVPTWPKEPVMPGETSTLEVRYATNRVGPFTKTITLTTNEGGDNKVIKVTGKVLKVEEEESVPEAQPSMLSPNNDKKQ